MRTWMAQPAAWFVAGLVGVIAVAAAHGEITGISGSASASVQEFVSGSAGQSDEASDSFPATSELPLQVVANLKAVEPENAAASVAAQFADPRELAQPNPEEFAINLALLSETAGVDFACVAKTDERREILFSPGEIAGTNAGDRLRLSGRLFLDGALTIFSPDKGKDLTGARVVMRVTVDLEGSTSGNVFAGELILEGQANGTVAFSTTGGFPRSSVLRADLSIFNPEFGVFEVAVLPFAQFDYNFDAIVGEPFALHATVTVEAENDPNHLGVAAVLGTPVEALADAISTSLGESTSAKFVTALQKERENPTGVPAFAQEVPPLFSFCGFLGFESLLGLAALGGVRWLRPYRPRRTR